MGSGGTSLAGAGGTLTATTVTGVPPQRTQSSGLLRSLSVNALTTAQSQQLCDWAANYYGGYGVVYDCGNGNTVKSKASQADCMSGLNTGASCTATVADSEDCMTSICQIDALSSAACQALLTC
jgi:hypothetical protein